MKTLSRILSMSFALICLSTVSIAQQYSFKTNTATYTHLSDSISLNKGLTWDDPSITIPIGFDFKFYDATIDTLYLSDWGYGAELHGNFWNSANDQSQLLIPYGADIVDRGADPNDPEMQPGSLSPISYKLEGSEGSRIAKIEWRNVGFYTDLDENDSSIDFTNFQLWLYEGTDVMEIHFGPNSITQPNFAYDGETGTYIGFYPNYDFGWDENAKNGHTLTGKVATPTLEYSKSIYENFMDGIIPNGTVYQFTPINSSIVELNASQFSVYPNPAHQWVTVEVKSEARISNVEIRNSLGALILEESIHNVQNHHIDISNLSSGIYILEIQTSQGLGVQKLTVQ